MTKFNVLSIDYYKEFECIGNKCEDNCCKDWIITIDKKTYNKYKKLPVSDFSKKLNNNINRYRKSTHDRHYAKINLIDKKCPMICKDGLCEVYLNLGPENMSYTCRTYPRVYNLVDNTIEKCLTVSCIEVAKNILLRKNPIEFNLDVVDIKEEMDAVKSVNTNKGKKINEKCFNEIREFSIGLIQDRRFTIENRLAILGLFINKLNEQCNNKEEVINLIENYKASIENGVYENLLEKLIKEDKFDAQLEFLMNIYSEMINRNIKNKRYITNFVNIINSLQLANENLERIKECYEEALNEHYRKFMKNYEHIYENYLVYYMFKILFPCNQESIMDSYIMLVIQFAILKMNLIGICGHYKEEMDEEKVVNLIQSYAVVTEHDDFIANRINKYLKENNLNTLAHMFIIMGK